MINKELLMNKKLIGATIATAAALTFSTAPIHSAFAQDGTDGFKCYGANACKGQSACKTANSSCKAQNTCKGHGVTMAADEKACKDAGGNLSET
jgi:uncharacterized membrane protein